MSKDNLVPDSVKGTGFFTPMDIAPGEYTTPSPQDTEAELREKLATHFSYDHHGVSNDGYANADYVMSLLTTEQTKLLEDIQGELPQKVNAKKLFKNRDIDWTRYEYECGHNQTIDQVRALLAKKKEGLK